MANDQGTIDRLAIEIDSESERACAGIERLTAALSGLKSVTSKQASGLGAISKQIKDMHAALNGVDSQKIGSAVNAISGLKDLSGIKVSASLGNQISLIGRALNEVQPANIGSAVNAIRGLKDLSGIKVSASIGNQISLIGRALNEVRSADIGQFASQVKQIADALVPLSGLGKFSAAGMINSLKNIGKINTALKDDGALKDFARNVKAVADAMDPLYIQCNIVYKTLSSLPGAFNKASAGAKTFSSATRRASKNAALFGTSLKSLGIRSAISSAWNFAKRTVSFISNMIESSSSYIETQNLFNIAMGQFAQEAQEYAQKVSDAMGIDPNAWMEAQGVFMMLATGFGVTSDRAYTMSKNLTQLGYDLSSFTNISVEDAMQKLQSGISGELEPLRRLGYDLSQARLEAVALSLGIDKAVSSMTQAEKAELRYYTIMTQATKAQGDMARTLSDPANQFRILRSEIEQAKRALGDLFLPIVSTFLPYLIAAVKIVRWIVGEIAALFNVELPEIDWSSRIDSAAGEAGSVEDALNGASDAADELKGKLASFDELNIIGTDAGAGGLGGALSGSGFDFALPEYDFISDAIQNQVDGIVNNWKKKLGPMLSWLKENLDLVLIVVTAIGLAFLTWKIGSGLVAGLGPVYGVVMVILGAALMVASALSMWENGVNWGNLLTYLSGAALLVGGLFLAAGPLGAAIGLVAAGIGLLVLGVKDWLNVGELTEESFTALASGVGAVSAALAILTGSWIPLLIGGLAIAILAMLTFSGESDTAIQGLQTTFEGFRKFFTGIFAGDMELAIEGLRSAFSGLEMSAESCFDAIEISAQAFFDWFDKITNGKFSESIATAEKRIFDLVDSWELSFSGVLEFLFGVFTGDWEMAFNGILDIAKAFVNKVISKVEYLINTIIDALNNFVSSIPALLGKLGLDGLIRDTSPQKIQHISLPRFEYDDPIRASDNMYVPVGVGGDYASAMTRTQPSMGERFIGGEQRAAVRKEALVASDGETSTSGSNVYLDGDTLGSNAETVRLMQETNRLLNQLVNKDSNVVFPTSVEAGRALQKSIDMYNVALGVK